MAADEIVHLYHPVQGHLEANGPVGGFGEQALDFIGREREGVPEAAAAGGIVHEGLAFGFGLGAARIQVLGAVKRVVGPAGGHQLLCILPVDGPSLALAVRGMRMALRGHFHHLSVLIHAFVGDDAAPVQGLDDILLCTGYEAVGVGILDADNEITALLLGIQVVI